MRHENRSSQDVYFPRSLLETWRSGDNHSQNRLNPSQIPKCTFPGGYAKNPYHRHVVSKQVFVRIDHEIHWALWRWAKRRHAHKSTTWIRRRYFQDRESHRNSFHTRITNREGDKITVRIFQAAGIPIRRHVKVRGDANPYDPAWESYFEQRLYRKTLDDLRYRSELRLQWRMQRGICPVCGEFITKKTGWHNHHIQWRVHGGGDELENRVLLHPTCHQQVHSPEYNGPSLRPSVGVRDARAA